MEVVILNDPAEIGRVAADTIESLLTRKPDAVLGLATGSSPLAIYDELADRCAKGQVSFKGARGFTLDEYVGLPPEHPERYRNVIDSVFVSRVDFAPGAVAGPDGQLHRIARRSHVDRRDHGERRRQRRRRRRRRPCRRTRRAMPIGPRSAEGRNGPPVWAALSCLRRARRLLPTGRRSPPRPRLPHQPLPVLHPLEARQTPCCSRWSCGTPLRRRRAGGGRRARKGRPSPPRPPPPFGGSCRHPPSPPRKRARAPRRPSRKHGKERHGCSRQRNRRVGRGSLP